MICLNVLPHRQRLQAGASGRNKDMLDMFLLKRMDMQQIAKAYGISRERVRQLLKRQGVTGRMLAGLKEKESRFAILESRNRLYQRAYGCTTEQALQIVLRCGKKVLKQYQNHKKNSHRRQIGFLLSLPEWINVWESSGKFGHRGLGQSGYVMARNGDAGPYAVGNVFIHSATQNLIDGRVAKAQRRKGFK